jgi:hypothetical protein
MQCRAKNVMRVGYASESVTNGDLHNKSVQVFLRNAQILCRSHCGIVPVVILPIRMKVVVLRMGKRGVVRILVLISDFVGSSSRTMTGSGCNSNVRDKTFIVSSFLDS